MKLSQGALKGMLLGSLLQACSSASPSPYSSSSSNRADVASSTASVRSSDVELEVENQDVTLEGQDEEAAPVAAITLPPVPPPPAVLPPAPPPFYPADCQAIKNAKPDAVSGVYKIYLNAALATRQAIDATCDMTTDGGGWTLMLNYNHLAATNPALVITTDKLPMMGSSDLGVDESLKPTVWGHAGNELLSKFTRAKELRFYCKSSENTRVMHFKTAEAGCLSAAKTGTGTCANIRGSFTALTGHTALLPGNLDRADINQLNSVLTSNTFGKQDAVASDPMWNIHGDGNLTSWECDFGSDNANFNTLHRIWFR